MMDYGQAPFNMSLATLELINNQKKDVNKGLLTRDIVLYRSALEVLYFEVYPFLNQEQKRTVDKLYQGMLCLKISRDKDYIIYDGELWLILKDLHKELYRFLYDNKLSYSHSEYTKGIDAQRRKHGLELSTEHGNDH